MIGRISATLISGLKPRSKPYEVSDSELRGFLARVQPSGVVSYYLSYRNAEGTRKRISLGKHGTITPVQARDAARRLAGDVAIRRDPAADKKKLRAEHAAEAEAATKRRTLSQFLEGEYSEWCTSQKKRGTDDVRRIRTAFAEFLNLPLTDLTGFRVEQWRTKRAGNGIAPATTNRDIAELRAMLGRAATWGFVEGNPMRGVKLPSVDNARVRFLTPGEEARVRASLAARDESNRAARVRGNQWRTERRRELLPRLAGLYSDHLTPMVLLSLNTGLRKAEVFNLTWERVNTDAKQLTVTAETAKSGKARHVPLNTEALKILRTWAKQTNPKRAGLVFPSPAGNPFDNVKKAWAGIVTSARLADFNWHDLRHTFASKLAMRRIDLNTIRELLGHADIKMTLRYAHLAPEHKAAAVAALMEHP